MTGKSERQTLTSPQSRPCSLNCSFLLPAPPRAGQSSLKGSSRQHDYVQSCQKLLPPGSPWLGWIIIPPIELCQQRLPVQLQKAEEECKKNHPANKNVTFLQNQSYNRLPQRTMLTWSHF